MISFPKLDTTALGGNRIRFFAAAMCIGMSVLAVQAQEKRRGIAGRGDFEDSPAPPPNAGAQPGNAGPASVPKFESKPRALPGAVVMPDAVVTSGAPFNTKNYLSMPAEADNAGPLVLDALAEFPEVYAMFAGPNDPGVKERYDRIKATLEFLKANPNPRNWNADAIEPIFGPYRVAFAKLNEAHKKPECVIPTGLSPTTSLAHVQAASNLIAITRPLIYADLARGDRAGAIGKFADVLRLSQDLQIRANPVVGLQILSMHRTVAEQILPILLNARGLTRENYDDILSALKSYRSNSIPLLPEMLKTEYLMQVQALADTLKPGGVEAFVKYRKMVESAQKNAPPAAPSEAELKAYAKIFTPENVEKLKSVMARHLKEQLAAIDDVGSPEDLKGLGKKLDTVSKSVFADASESAFSKEHFAGLIKELGGIDPKIADAVKALGPDAQKAAFEFLVTQIGLHDAPAMQIIVIPILYYQNDQGIMESLAAVRRWYVTKKSVPKDKTLEDICKEAGLEGAPLDIFSGKPMRLVWTGSGPAISTAAHDFKDDEGKTVLAEADRTKTLDAVNGDYVVTLALGANPAAPAQAGAAPGAAPGVPAGFGPAGPQGGSIRPPGAGGSGSGGRRGRAEGGTAVEP